MGNKDLFKWAAFYTVIIAIGAIVLLNAWAAVGGFPVGGMRYIYALVVSVIFGVAIAVGQVLMVTGGNSIFLGSSETAVPQLTLSRVRTLMIQKAWLEAKEELAGLWELYPGNADILQEYEHVLVDHMHAPSGFADFLIKAVPVLKGDEKAYALFRIAELFAGELDRKSEAGLWCHRLLVEHPGSNYEEQAKKILEILPPPPKTA